MKLITKEIAKKLPKIGHYESLCPNEIKVPLKLFNPTGIGTWYIIEMNPESGEMFGWCDLGFPELGCVSFDELKNFRGRFGLGIERDLSWDGNTTLRQVINREVQ